MRDKLDWVFISIMAFSVISVIAFGATPVDPRQCQWVGIFSHGGELGNKFKPETGTIWEAQNALNRMASNKAVVFHATCWMPGEQPDIDLFKSFKGGEK